jgi:2-keto-4-pentenoate hydratase
MKNDSIVGAAQLIAEARIAGRHLERLPEAIRPGRLEEGYLVQDQVHILLEEAGHGALVGHKIGATTPVMQRYMEIDHPCAGGILASSVHQSGVTLPHAQFRRVGIECEVAARIGRDLTPSEAPYDRAKVARHVDSVMAAIELVDDRYTEWQSLGTATLTADDFFAAGSVLAAPKAPGAVGDLAALTGRAIVNGTERARGVGADVMGHPYEALAWLANNLAARGHTLKAGQFVTTGSLVKTLWLDPGDHAAIEIEGLGRVEVTFVER